MTATVNEQREMKCNLCGEATYKCDKCQMKFYDGDKICCDDDNHYCEDCRKELKMED